MSTKTVNFLFDKPQMTDTPAVTIPQLSNNFDIIDNTFAKSDLHCFDITSPLYGADANGVADSTTAIQNCLNACSNSGGYVYIPKGTFMINAITSLNIPNNIRIVFHPQATIKAINTNAQVYTILKLNSVSNVRIEGNFANIIGDRDTNTQTTGEGGMCVRITDCKNIYIENLVASKGFGDGYYVGTNINSYSENIYLINCTSDSNRRNGLSITSVKNMGVIGGHYKNTNGTNPQFGIDVEPNTPQNAITNVLIKGVRTSNNQEGGIALTSLNMKGSANNFDVTVEDWLSEGDGTSSSVSYGVGLLLDNDSSGTSQVYGKIEIRKASIIGPDAQGIYVQGWCLAPKTVIKDVTIYNPNTATSSYAPSQAAIGMDYNSGDPTGVAFGNITFERCGVIDNRTTKLTKYAYAFQSVSGRPFNNINIIDPITDGVTTSNLFWSVPDASSGFTVRYNTPSFVNVSTSQAITNYAGQVVNATAAATLTLPSANYVQGTEYTVQYGAASGTVTLAVSAGDTIINKGAAVTSVALTVAGTFMKVRSIGGNKWIVVEQNIS